MCEDFQDLVPLQYGASRISNSSKDKRLIEVQNKNKYPFVESRLVSDKPKNILNNSMKTVHNNDFSNDFTDSRMEVQNRNLQLLVLAIIAAFFVALGNNIRRVLG